MARRPRWIGAFLLAIALAASFAALGQWQLERSIDDGAFGDQSVEEPVPLEQLTDPASPLSEELAGRLVTVEGVLVAGDYTVHTERRTSDDGAGGDGPSSGGSGAWLVGHVRTPDGASVPVALGWAPTAADARAAAPATDAEIDIEGRYLPSDGPEESDFMNGELNAVSAAELVNVWRTVESAYPGYVVSHERFEGLELIPSSAPRSAVEVNWLNLFYALEWVIFGGFAVFLWYRLVRDEVEKQLELASADDARIAPPARP